MKLLKAVQSQITGKGLPLGAAAKRHLRIKKTKRGGLIFLVAGGLVAFCLWQAGLVF